jgi:hypothetical protein
MQVMGQPRMNHNQLDYVVLAAREYHPISQLSFDAIVQARIQNLLLKKKLQNKNLTTTDPQKEKKPEQFCRQCGKTDSPEWRKGPLGAKTYIY